MTATTQSMKVGFLSVGLALAACGGGSSDIDASTAIDARPHFDAPVASCSPRSGSTVTTTPVTNVDDLPVLVTFAPGGDPRLFIVERNGAIQIYENGALIDTPFIDISDNNGGPVLGGGEQGLLGLAFHPGYEENRKFYVYYTTPDANVIAEYQASAGDRNVADPGTARVVLSIDDPESNHNGGMIEFGRDGYLYIGTGDGGGGGDPGENGQDPDELLAKMLRIDVDSPGGGREYGIPPGNPFVAGGGAPEVLITGLRNPWRWSFDRETDDLYIGDVGQGAVEEIHVIPYDEMAGADLGWDDCEGSLDYEGTGCDSPSEPRRLPTYEQIRPPAGTSNFEAIIGGAVYRSICYPDLVGRYFFTDNNAGGLWSFVWSGGQATDVIEHPGTFPANPSSIYMDAFGELYITAGNGDIVHIEVQ
jgi:glucose/arabinose dehydrogenase